MFRRLIVDKSGRKRNCNGVIVSSSVSSFSPRSEACPTSGMKGPFSAILQKRAFGQPSIDQQRSQTRSLTNSTRSRSDGTELSAGSSQSLPEVMSARIAKKRHVGLTIMASRLSSGTTVSACWACSSLTPSVVSDSSAVGSSVSGFGGGGNGESSEFK